MRAGTPRVEMSAAAVTIKKKEDTTLKASSAFQISGLAVKVFNWRDIRATPPPKNQMDTAARKTHYCQEMSVPKTVKR